MFEREDTTFRDIREKSLMQWLSQMAEHSDIEVRGGVKLAKEYIESLKRDIQRLKDESQLKSEYLKRRKG